MCKRLCRGTGVRILQGFGSEKFRRNNAFIHVGENSSRRVRREERRKRLRPLRNWNSSKFGKKLSLHEQRRRKSRQEQLIGISTFRILKVSRSRGRENRKQKSRNIERESEPFVWERTRVVRSSILNIWASGLILVSA
jgi:hypothetical protein